jgi:hypothetical protein
MTIFSLLRRRWPCRPRLVTGVGKAGRSRNLLPAIIHISMHRQEEEPTCSWEDSARRRLGRVDLAETGTSAGRPTPGRGLISLAPATSLGPD